MATEREEIEEQMEYEYERAFHPEDLVPMREVSESEAGEMDEDQFESDVKSESSEDSNGAIDENVMEEMENFQETFRGISTRFRLINRIGEGTFSTVYKAEDLLYQHYNNDWDLDGRENDSWPTAPASKKRRVAVKPGSKSPRYVAIKKIYVTSSPSRIQNELELLYALRGCDSVCPLITAFRHEDQVVAVLPYFRHVDFREYYRSFTIQDMKPYFRSLFSALAAVHKHKILHRDIKPTNFLYDIARRRGVLVDFGLAEREGADSAACICKLTASQRRDRINNSLAATQPKPHGYLKDDPRPSRRANRAGTRGFRAPEVLLKCTEQTTKIDIWSAGVIMLSMLCRRFPFFNSLDDVEAMIEIATIFGKRRMRTCALLHGAVFEVKIPTISDVGYSMSKIVLWSTNRSAKDKAGNSGQLSEEETHAIEFMQLCLVLDPAKRISAEEALAHEFLAEGEGEYQEVEEGRF
ncbi:MAG: hypothetical protein M1829_006603 [Trizodia sp. TS-e1964]|nr:MAG: hypothetical protein M1829_006603 [Trizodia sp. TS-e1964]